MDGQTRLRFSSVWLQVAVTIYLGFAALWLLGFRQTYITVLGKLGVQAFRYPFLDTEAITAAIQCRRAGIDVFRVNPCDVFGRPHVYSPLWLRADFLPVSVDWTPYLGLALVLLFFWALTRLPPVRSIPGALLMTAAGISPPVLFALERGNNDLLIFAMATAATILFMRGPHARGFGTAIITLAAGLKYYPLVLLVHALRERTVRCLLLTGISLAVLGSALLLDLHDVFAVLKILPNPDPFSEAFGAAALPTALAESFGWSKEIATGLRIAFTLGSISAAVPVARSLRPALAALTDSEVAFLTAGAALLVGCFMTAMNIFYRDIFFLLTIPGLSQMSRQKTQTGQLVAISLGIMLFLLWVPAIAAMTGWLGSWRLLWPLHVVGWWWIVTVLAAVLWCEVLSSQAVAPLRAAVRKTVGRRQPSLPEKVHLPQV